MFVDHKTQIGKYAKLDKRLEAVAEFLKSTKLEGLEVGRYDLTDNIFYMVSRNKKLGTARFEAHRKYIDVQYIVSGAERMLWKPLATAEECEPYNEEKDIAFYKQNGSENVAVDLYKDSFVIFYPHDAHSPEHPLDSGETVKIVFKIPV